MLQCVPQTPKTSLKKKVKKNASKYENEAKSKKTITDCMLERVLHRYAMHIRIYFVSLFNYFRIYSCFSPSFCA